MSDDDLPEDDRAGPQIGVGPSALLLVLVWPLLQVAGTDAGVLVPALIGVGGGLAVAAAAAFLAGVFEGVVGHTRAASTAFAAAAAAAAVYWWTALPIWAAAPLTLVGLGGWLSLWRRERALAGLAPPRLELPEAVQLELDALPPLDDPLAAARDAVVGRYTHIEKAAIELGDDPLVDGRALRRDAEATARAALRQIRRLADMADAADLAEVRAEGQQRLDRLVAGLGETRARLLTFLQARDEGQTPALEAHAEQLRHAATGLRETQALEGQ